MCVDSHHLIQSAITKYHRPGGLWTTKIYSPSFGGQKYQDQGTVIVVPSPRFLIAHFSLHLHMVEGVRELCGMFFIRALTPIMRVETWWPNHLSKAQRPHLLKPSDWALRFQLMNLGRCIQTTPIFLSHFY